jgi:probable addiction module antidote protein
MAMKTTKWDAADHLTNEKAVIAYLNAALDDGDPAVITAALGDIARAKGIARIAEEVGVTREGLYKSLSATGRPEFKTVMKVSQSLGFSFVVKAKPKVKKIAPKAIRRKPARTAALRARKVA